MGMEAFNSKPQVSGLHDSTQHFRLVGELHRTLHSAHWSASLLYKITQSAYTVIGKGMTSAVSRYPPSVDLKHPEAKCPLLRLYSAEAGYLRQVI